MRPSTVNHISGVYVPLAAWSAKPVTHTVTHTLCAVFGRQTGHASKNPADPFPKPQSDAKNLSEHAAALEDERAVLAELGKEHCKGHEAMTKPS